MGEDELCLAVRRPNRTDEAKQRRSKQQAASSGRRIKPGESPGRARGESREPAKPSEAKQLAARNPRRCSKLTDRRGTFVSCPSLPS
jgi:hypothetical protein